MKVSMKNRESFIRWFLVTCASSESDTHSNKDSKFNQLVGHPDWDSENIEVSVMINGIEFSNLDDVFKRVENHIEQKVEERLAEQHLDSVKLDRIREILSTRSVDEIENV